MFALSVESSWSRPSDFSGGMLFQSDFLCLMKDQKRFIQFGFSSFSLLGVTISSMYFQYAMRICFWDSRLSSLYFAMSLVLFDFFFLLYALSFFLINLRISVVIHGQPSLVRAVLCGTFLLRLSSVVLQKSSQMASALAFSLYRDVIWARSFSTFSHFAFL